MANTWIAINPLTTETLKEFRSVDFDLVELYDEFGIPIDVFDKTDGMRFLGSIVVDDDGPLVVPADPSAGKYMKIVLKEAKP